MLALATGAVIGGGAVATICPWLGSGPGASMTPLDLSRAVLSGRFDDLVPRAVGIVPVLPIVIAALWLIAGAVGRFRLVGYVVCLALSLACLYGLHVVLGSGAHPGLGAVGLIVAATGTGIGLATSVRFPGHRDPIQGVGGAR